MARPTAGRCSVQRVSVAGFVDPVILFDSPAILCESNDRDGFPQVHCSICYLCGCHCRCRGLATTSQLYQEACHLCEYSLRCWPFDCLPFAKEALRHLLNIDNLYAKAERLEEIAYSTEGKNRVIGSKGHETTVAWIKETLDQFPDYYTVQLQGVPLLVGVSANLTANNQTIEVLLQNLHSYWAALIGY